MTERETWVKNTITLSPPDLRDAERLIEVLTTLGGAERIEDTERSY
jgi:hypothetical protein